MVSSFTYLSTIITSEFEKKRRLAVFKSGFKAGNGLAHCYDKLKNWRNVGVTKILRNYDRHDDVGMCQCQTRKRIPGGAQRSIFLYHASNGTSNLEVGAMGNSLCTWQNGPCSTTNSFKWDIPQILMPQLKSSMNYAVLILNRPLIQSPAFMIDTWNNATIRMTVDGGTRRWDQYLSDISEEVCNTIKLPDLITGDFDSITEDILEKYKKKGCEVVHTPDQDRTDFTKALMQLHNLCQERRTQLDHVLVLGQSSGRIDQTIGNIHTLFLVHENHLLDPKTKVLIVSDDCISWLLHPGDHEIVVPESALKHRKAWCSLVPIGQPCESVTTTGLKWNLDNQRLKFGELVSTSNTFDGSEIVTVNSSHTILWSMRTPHLVDL